MIKIGIYGYGNLGKGVEQAAFFDEDIELVGVFTKRNPSEVQTIMGVNTYSVTEVESFKDIIDVMILCGGSAKDLPIESPNLVKLFNIVDSFDTHKEIYNHYIAVNKEAINHNKIGIISVGWDPGMFSLNRTIMEAILPKGKDYTFWGIGVSQGHSDAIRKIKGVVDARQYTIPIKEAMEEVRKGINPELSNREKHLRECFVVVEDNANKEKIEEEIKTMPNYFNEYDTIVNFISKEEMESNHSKMCHGGFVIRCGKTGFNEQNNHIIEYSLKLDSNPEFTGSVLIAYAKAAYRMSQRGISGCKTVLDIAPIDLCSKNYEYLLKNNI